MPEKRKHEKQKDPRRSRSTPMTEIRQFFIERFQHSMPPTLASTTIETTNLILSPASNTNISVDNQFGFFANNQLSLELQVSDKIIALDREIDNGDLLKVIDMLEQFSKEEIEQELKSNLTNYQDCHRTLLIYKAFNEPHHNFLAKTISALTNIKYTFPLVSNAMYLINNQINFYKNGESYLRVNDILKVLKIISNNAGVTPDELISSFALIQALIEHQAASLTEQRTQQVCKK